jgi:protein SCO1/2
MNQLPRRLELSLWVGLILTALALLLALLLAQLKLRGFSKPLPVFGNVGEFTLTNQLAQPVHLANLKGRVWVADVIFTRCAGPCLTMTRAMKELQRVLPRDGKAQLISITTDPEYDTPAVLKRYGERFGADPKRWTFLTGSKQEIQNLAVQSLKLSVNEKTPQERSSTNDLFIHSTIFVIADKKGRLRGIFESTGQDVNTRKVRAQIQTAIRRLERER